MVWLRLVLLSLRCKDGMAHTFQTSASHEDDIPTEPVPSSYILAHSRNKQGLVMHAAAPSLEAQLGEEPPALSGLELLLEDFAGLLQPSQQRLQAGRMEFV